MFSRVQLSRFRRVARPVSFVAVLALAAAACASGGPADDGAGPRADGGEDTTVTTVDIGAEAGGCGLVQERRSEGHLHVAAGERVEYGTAPPTSGLHYSGQLPDGGFSPGPTGVHTQPIPNEIQAHNLEHGHIGIAYQPGLDPAIVEVLAEVTRSDPTWIFMAPYQDMPHQVAFTAWTVLLPCDSPTEEIRNVARDFIARYKDNGRESIPGRPLVTSA